jgi:hypothetical protein
VKYEFQNLAIHFSNHSSRMFPFVNVALQAVLSRIIKTLGVKGAQAAAVNLFGQSVIHRIGVAAGPIGWTMGGVMVDALEDVKERMKEAGSQRFVR